jgi:MFS family permease
MASQGPSDEATVSSSTGLGIRGAIRRRDVKLLITGFSVSSAGDWLYSIALTVFVYDRTHSAFWVSLAGILRLAPYVIFSPFAGVLGDRYDKKTVMVASDSIRAILMLLMTVVATTDTHVGVVIGLAFLTTAAGTPYGPAMTAALPHFVKEDELAGMNALVSAVDTTALVVGPAVGGLLLLLGSPALAFAVNAATFIISVFTLLLIRTRAGGTDIAEHQSVLREIGDGIRAVLEAKDALIVVLFVMGLSFLYGQEIVLTVLVAKERLGIGSEGVGWLDAAVGAGGLIIAFFTSKIALSRRPNLILLISILCCGVPLAALAVTKDLTLALALMAVIGVGTVMLDVIGTTILQRTLSPDLLARVFGLMDSLGVAAVLVGTLIAPIAVAAVELQGALMVAGLLLPVFAVLTYRRVGRLTAAADAGKTRLEPILRLLRGMPLFQGAKEPTLESLAAAAIPMAVEQGTVIIAEGAPADYFYVIEDGTFEALFQGGAEGQRRVNVMDPGDYFGEIGLIERIPRTATVKAVSDGVLYRIDGDAFVDLLTTSRRLNAALLRTSRARLARTHPDRVLAHQASREHEKRPPA